MSHSNKGMETSLFTTEGIRLILQLDLHSRELAMITAQHRRASMHISGIKFCGITHPLPIYIYTNPCISLILIFSA